MRKLNLLLLRRGECCSTYVQRLVKMNVHDITCENGGTCD